MCSTDDTLDGSTNVVTRNQDNEDKQETGVPEKNTSAEKSNRQNLAVVLAILSVFVFSGNGELLQALQLAGGQVTISPIANLILCHSGGLIFLPYLFRPPPVEDPSVSRLYIFAAAFLFSVVLMGYNYAWIKSTTFVPAALTNSICQTSVMMVYLASVAMFGEPLTWSRSVGVLCCLCGLMLASGFSSSGGMVASVGVDMTTGAWFAALSAFGVTVYQVLFRRMFHTCKGDVRFLGYFFACVSVVHIVIILPLALLASYLGLEALSFPTTAGGMTVAVISAAMASAVNMLYLCVMSWGRPMLMPCANVLTIPALVVLDIVFHGIVPPGVEIIGHVLIVASIILILDVRVNALDVLTYYWQQKAHLGVSEDVEKGMSSCNTSSLTAPLLNTAEIA